MLGSLPKKTLSKKVHTMLDFELLFAQSQRSKAELRDEFFFTLHVIGLRLGIGVEACILPRQGWMHRGRHQVLGRHWWSLPRTDRISLKNAQHFLNARVHLQVAFSD